MHAKNERICHGLSTCTGIDDLPHELTEYILLEAAVTSTANDDGDYADVLSSFALVCSLWHQIVNDPVFRNRFTDRLLRVG